MADNMADDDIQKALLAAKSIDTSNLPGAVVKPYEPTWRDRLANWMMGGNMPSPERERFVEGFTGSRGIGTSGMGLVDLTPVGQAFAGQEAAREGDYKGVAMAALPMGGAEENLALQIAKRQLSPVGLYSHAAEAASALPQATGSVDQMIAMLRKQSGVTEAELKNAGLLTEEGRVNPDWLAKGKIGREDLASHLQSSMPQVEETVLGVAPKAIPYPEEYQKIEQSIIDKYSPEMEKHHNIYLDRSNEQHVRNAAQRNVEDLRDQMWAEIDRALPDREVHLAKAKPEALPTKYGSYTLPGGENYREVLLKYKPQNLSSDEAAELAEMRAREPLGQIRSDEIKRFQDLIDKEREAPQGFKSSHWDDPNVLAHIRMADRTGPNGEKILHVEEVQSDWGQKGKKQGFKISSDEHQKLLDEAWDARSKMFSYFENLPERHKPTGQEIHSDIDRMIRGQDPIYINPEGEAKPLIDRFKSSYAAVNKQESALPNAPYVTSTSGWTDLAMKRVLKEAAEGGYDKVVWTPGAEQAGRYDLSKQISKVQYDPNEQRLFAYDHNGKMVIDERGVEPNELDNYIGKDPADKLRSEVNNATSTLDEYDIDKDPETGEWGLYLYGEPMYEYGGEPLTFGSKSEARDYLRELVDKEIESNPPTISGLDLQVGGEGMKEYYDKILPKRLQEVAKKHDKSAKVGYTDVMLPPSGKRGSNNPPMSAPGLDITPQMRESILKGQGAFERGGRTGYANEGAVREEDFIGPALDIARKYEDPTARIESGIRGLSSNLAGLDLEANVPQFHTGLPRPQIGGAGLLPSRPSNMQEDITVLRPTVADPQRMAYPGIYMNPRVMAEMAAARVAPEDPALKQLFGVTREDLYQMGKGRVGNREPELAFKSGKVPESSAKVMTQANEQRLIDALAEAQKQHPLVQGMDPWYVMDPMYKRLEQLVGPEEASARYSRLNTITSMMSPASDVVTEIKRGLGAHYLDRQGRLPEFIEHGGTALANRGSDFPQELMRMPGHAYHSTSQAGPLENYARTGKVEMDSPKVPLYMQSSGVPETGFQTRLPVPDAHWTRAVGLSDTRTSKGFGASPKMPEYEPLGSWFSEKVAKPLEIEGVPAQARLWGLMAPHTGVETAIGVPKLELFAKQIMEVAKHHKISPEKARDLILLGETYSSGGRALGNNAIDNAIRMAAAHLQNMGNNGDTILAHINPHEAAILKAMGGSGRINPRTGLMQFDEEGQASQAGNISGTDAGSISRGETVNAATRGTSEGTGPAVMGGGVGVGDGVGGGGMGGGDMGGVGGGGIGVAPAGVQDATVTDPATAAAQRAIIGLQQMDAIFGMTSKSPAQIAEQSGLGSLGEFARSNIETPSVSSDVQGVAINTTPADIMSPYGFSSMSATDPAQINADVPTGTPGETVSTPIGDIGRTFENTTSPTAFKTTDQSVNDAINAAKQAAMKAQSDASAAEFNSDPVFAKMYGALETQQSTDSTQQSQDQTQQTQDVTQEFNVIYDPVQAKFVRANEATPQARAMAGLPAGDAVPSSPTSTQASYGMNIGTSPTVVASAAAPADAVSQSPTSTMSAYGISDQMTPTVVAVATPTGTPSVSEGVVGVVNNPIGVAPVNSNVTSVTAPADAVAVAKSILSEVPASVPVPTPVQRSIDVATADTGVDLPASTSTPMPELNGIPANVPVPTPVPARQDQSDVQTALDIARAQLDFSTGQKVNELEQTGQTATFPNTSNTQDQEAAMRSYMESIGLDPNNPDDVAQVQSRIIYENNNPKLDYYTKSWGDVFDSAFGSLFGKKSPTPIRGSVDVGGPNSEKGGGAGQSKKDNLNGPGRKAAAVYPYQTELAGSENVPSLSGLTAKQFADAYAGGDLNLVHGKLDWSLGAPRIVYYVQ